MSSALRIASNCGQLADRLERAGPLDGGTELLVQQPAVGVQSAITTVFQHGRLVASHLPLSAGLGVGGSAMMQESAWHPAVASTGGNSVSTSTGTAACFWITTTTLRENSRRYRSQPAGGPSVNGWLSGVNVVESLLRVSLDEPVAWTQTQNLGPADHEGFLILLAKALERWAGPIAGRIWRHRPGRDGYRDMAHEVTRLADDRWSTSRIGCSARPLLRPPAAEAVVRHTVENYSLPETAARQVREL